MASIHHTTMWGKQDINGIDSVDLDIVRGIVYSVSILQFPK